MQIMKERERIKMKIFVSPSIQQNNINRAVGYVEETQMNLIADILIPELVKRGFEIKRNNKDAPGVTSIVAESNAWGADYHIAIHSNATGLLQSKRRGCEVYCDNPSDLSSKSTQFAHSIYNAVTAIAPVPGRGVLSGHTTMSEVRYTNAHSALIEIDYHDSDDGARWIMANIKNLAYAILKGIVNYLEGEDMVICKKGDRDSVTGTKNVISMQTGLTKLGYKMENGGVVYPPDGDYGTGTSNGLLAFLKANGLTGNGETFDDKMNAVMLMKLSQLEDYKAELATANAKIITLTKQLDS